MSEVNKSIKVTPIHDYSPTVPNGVSVTLRRAELPRSDYHFCAVPKCKTQIIDGAPHLCPHHQSNFCPHCQGHGQRLLYHNEALTPSVRFKKCSKCKGRGTLGGKVEDALNQAAKLIRKQ
jgi:hypothetical protein